MLRIAKRAKELTSPVGSLLHSLPAVQSASQPLPLCRHTNHQSLFSTSAALSAPHKNFSRHPRHKKRVVRRVAKRYAEEAALRAELTQLERKVVQLDKRAAARANDEILGPIDEIEIETLYEALMAPEGMNGVENEQALKQSSARRLALARQRSLQLLPEPESSQKRAPLIAKGQYEAVSKLLGEHELPSSQQSRLPVAVIGEDVGRLQTHSQRVQHRLQTLCSRIAALSETLRADGPDSSKRAALASEAETDRQSLASRMKRFLDEQRHAGTNPSSEGSGVNSVLFRAVHLSDTTAAASIAQQPRSSDLPPPSNVADNDLRPEDLAFLNARKQAVSVSPDKLGADRPTVPYELLQHLDDVITKSLSATESSTLNVAPEQDHSTAAPPKAALPLALATTSEWSALAVACAEAADDSALARVMTLMDRSGQFPPPVKLFNAVMDVYANRGDVKRCEDVLGYIESANLQPDSHTHHCLIKAQIRAMQTTKALDLLSKLEATTPAAVHTYTLVIHHLLKHSSRAVQSIAWSLFHRMRFAAHPVPDAPLYGLMIRACARGIPEPNDLQEYPLSRQRSSPPDTLRALDLFREMTTRYGVRPNVEVYSGVILACARSKEYFHEAFRLFGEMVRLEEERVRSVSGRKARGDPVADKEQYQRFSPDRFTFEALLQGCARNGDLPRARWVLAEMLRSTAPLYDGTPALYIDELDRIEMQIRRPTSETLALVMWTYASYEPPVKRSDHVQAMHTEHSDSTSVLAEESHLQSNDLAGSALTSSSQPEGSVAKLDQEEAILSFTQQVPLTAAQVVHEARALMARILADQPSALSSSGPLGSVQPTAHLAQAYLSVLRAHLPRSQRLRALADAVSTRQSDNDLSASLFEQFGLTPNGHTYLLLMNQCAIDKDRKLANTVMESAWTSWCTIEQQATEEHWDSKRRAREGIDSIAVSQAWAARITSLAKSNLLDEAIKTLRGFVETYPPPPNVQKPSVSSSSQGLSSLSVAVRPTQGSPAKVPTALSLGPFTPPAEILLALRRSDSSNHGLGGNVDSSKRDRYAPRPSLSFTDLQLLHHRLVVAGRVRPRGFIKWVDHAYRGAGTAMRQERDAKYREKKALLAERVAIEQARWNVDEQTSESAYTPSYEGAGDGLEADQQVSLGNDEFQEATSADEVAAPPGLVGTDLSAFSFYQDHRQDLADSVSVSDTVERLQQMKSTSNAERTSAGGHPTEGSATLPHKHTARSSPRPSALSIRGSLIRNNRIVPDQTVPKSPGASAHTPLY